eukprot:Platyproteum_vivax@DN6989_c0_g1_i1.p1
MLRTDKLNCLNPVPSDLEIAQTIKPLHIKKLLDHLNLSEDDYDLYGAFKAKVNLSTMEKLKGKPDGKYIVVTGVNPTPLGEGKTTVTVGVSQALGAHLQKSVFTCIRQPSMGPTFGMKGGAAGGGYAQVIPMEDFNLHLTGDIHAVSAANNLLCAAIDVRIHHEATQENKALFDRILPYDELTKERKIAPCLKARMERLGLPLNPEAYTDDQKRQLVRLDMDPATIGPRRVVDINDRMLRKIQIGLAETEKRPRDTGFDIAVGSEVMAILALATSLPNMRERLGKIVVASNMDGEPVTADDVGVAGAMCVLLKDALCPTLMQTLEGTAVFVHAGPFANIAHGNSSVVADLLALKLVGKDGYVLTECGFGADIGLEKFVDIKCRASGLKPDCCVITATIRALKYHGGAPAIVAGKKVDKVYSEENLDYLEKGMTNLAAHINNSRKFGFSVVVAINERTHDTPNELNMVEKMSIAAGAEGAVAARHWAEGGKGALKLANLIVDVCKNPSGFQFLYPLNEPIKQKIERICVGIYGASGVDYSEVSSQKIELFEKQGLGGMPICMAKTQYSLSHDASLRGAPSGFRVPIKDIRVSAGAGFVFPLCGPIMTMPGLPTRPAFYDVDLIVTPENPQGVITGLF